MQPISERVSLALLFFKCISCLESNPSLLITQDCLSLVVHAFILIRLSEKKTCKKDRMEKDNYSCPYSINFTFFEDDPFGKRRRYAESEAYKEAPSRWEGDILKDVIMWPGHTKEGNPTMIHRVFREYFLVLVKRAKPTHCPWVRHRKARVRRRS